MGERIVRILAFPFWQDNPYLNQLYLDATARGILIEHVRRFDILISQIETAGRGDVLHLNWTSPIVQPAASDREAIERLRQFEGAVDDALERGMRLIWTVHNKLPHETRHLDQELELVRFIVDRAHVIHVISPSTTDAVSDLYALDPAKTVSVPHSSYWGVYDHAADRSYWRARLGLDDDDVALLFLGQMRPYKGIAELLDAIERLTRADPRFVLLLAGKTTDEDRETIDALIPKGARVIREHRFVPDDEMPLWLRAGDISVLPYRNVLNSGSIALAATFGLPVVVPEQPSLRYDFGDQDWAWFYPQEAGGDGIAELILSSSERLLASGPSAARWASAYTPYDMSRRFSAEVLARLER